MTARRFEETGFNPELYEYEIRFPAEQQYASISLEDLEKVLLDVRNDGRGFVGGLRYRTKDSVDKFIQVDKRDVFRMLDCISVHLHGDAVCKVPEELEGITIEPEQEVLCEPPPETKWEYEAQYQREHGCECGCEHECEEDDEGTMFRFCCHPMMKAMLGGNGTVVISMETGELLLGADAMHYCPFCGKRIVTHAPPIEVIEPEE